MFGILGLSQSDMARSDVIRWFVGLNLLWALPYFGALVLTAEPGTVVSTTNILTHYLLGGPGGVLAAVGLRRQNLKTLDMAMRSRIHRPLQLGEIAMGAFGILHLVIPLVLPSEMRSNAQEVIPAIVEGAWVLVGVLLTVGINRALNTAQLEIEQWLEGVERLQALAVDRERIGRDLHDGIIQSIYAAGLLLESVQPIIPSDPMRAQAQLGRVMDNLNATIQDIRRYIFDLRSDMPDDDLQSGIERLLRDFRINTLLETDLELSGTPVEIMSMERRRHIFQIVREALANTAKHASARWVKVALQYN
jgi:signal transduction histidine kinase